MERNKKLIIVMVWIAVILIVGLLIVYYPQNRTTCIAMGNQAICTHCPINDTNATAFSCNGLNPAK